LSKTTLTRRLIHSIEAAGLHRVLAFFGTHFARRITGQDVALFFDEIWVRRIGDVSFGDKARFNYYIDEFKSWNNQHKMWLEDPADYWFFVSNAEPGDVVVDVGAGFGNDALMFSRAVGPTGRVIAIEAHPVAFRKLEKTCKWSGLDNVTPLGVAVGDDNGTVRISGDDDKAHNTIAEDVTDAESSMEVQLRRFDDLADELGIKHVSLLKMNIEGAETSALQGMPNTLAKTAAVAISCHDFRAAAGESEYFRTKAVVAEMLTKAGFVLRNRDDDPRPYIRDTLYGYRPHAE
jgi:FkbM family methyltransferase